MTSRLAIRLLLLTCSFSNLFGYELYHNPPEKFLQGVPGQMEVLTPHYLPDPDYVKLYIRSNDQHSYQELHFYELEGAWFCDIPAAYMNTDTLNYYISASFGAAGLAAFPAQDPALYPQKIPMVKFIVKNGKLSPILVKESVVDYTVTPWVPKPAFRSNTFPIIYIPKPNRAFVESGYIKIVGNKQASLEDLIKSMMYLCLQENADAITGIKYSLLSDKPDIDTVKGHIELEGVYLRRVQSN